MEKDTEYQIGSGSESPDRPYDADEVNKIEVRMLLSSLVFLLLLPPSPAADAFSLPGPSRFQGHRGHRRLW